MDYFAPQHAVRILACAAIGASWMGCSNDAAPTAQPSAEEQIRATTSRIYGSDTTRDDNWGQDSFFADTVVQVLTDSGKLCTGTLITPRLVLTAAHCVYGQPGDSTPTIYVGPQSGAWKRVIRADGANYMDLPDAEDPNANLDIAVVHLTQPVMDVADSRRPMHWTGWTAAFPPEEVLGSKFGDDYARFGIAGWSSRSGPWECPGGEGGDMDSEHLTWRQHAEDIDQWSFIHGYGDDVITWLEGNNNKGNVGDSGGPLYHMLSGGAREVVGVLSKKNCRPELDLSYSRTLLYADVTHGIQAEFIREFSDDGRNEDWLLRHGFGGRDHWGGEVDYLGPCTTEDGAGVVDGPGAPPPTQDLDCDHWYDVHDNCPRDYNPGQEEDEYGKGIACQNRARLDDYDPNNPGPAHKTIDLGVCTSDQPDCPIGICGIVEVTGQFFQRPSTVQGFRYDAPEFRGSYVRLSTDGGHYKLQLDIKPDDTGAATLSFMPPSALPGCIALRDILSIPNPELCTIAEGSIRYAPPDSASFVALPPGLDSVNVLSGLIGNIGFPGSETNSQRYSSVRVSNGDYGFSVLSQVRDLTSNSSFRSFEAQSFSFSCPGWTHKFANGLAGPNPSPGRTIVTAFAVPATAVLVPGGAATTRCFLTAVGGPWGGYSGNTERPAARIHSDPVSNDVLLTVTPTSLAGNYQVVEAQATCVDLTAN